MIKPVIKVNFKGEGGNIFAVAGAATRALKEIGKAVESNVMVSKVYASESYDAALNIIREYVDLKEE